MNPKSIKIFISATMEELEDSIELFANENIEQLNHWGIGENKVHKYSTGINEENKTGMDYSYLNPKYFNELSDIANTIKNDKTDNKWLVFVQSFDDMNYLLEELKGINGGVASIKSGDENNINFNSIMDKNKFISRVLITTKVLDNGVNIEDDKLKNIVVMTLDRTTFIQEIGRVRIDIENAPEINLFIRKKYKKTFTTLLKKYNEKQEQIDLFNENLNLFKRKFNNDADKVKKDVIRLGRDTQWELNKIGLFRLNKDRMFAEMMENRMRKNKFAFIEEQLSWIGLEDTFDEDNMIEDVMLEEDKMSLEGYLSSMFENKIVLLKAPDREELIKTIGLIDTHNSNLGIKKNIEANIKYVKNINTLNSYLDEEIGSKFRIKQFETSRNIEGKKKKFKNAWKIVKIIE
ncbi:helicase-related protein [Clostridium perfringens]